MGVLGRVMTLSREAVTVYSFPRVGEEIESSAQECAAYRIDHVATHLLVLDSTPWQICHRQEGEGSSLF
jgi:hypothetical protein